MIVRVLLGVVGLLGGAYGLWLLVSTVPLRSLGLLAVWLAAALVVHDAVWSPGLIGVGAALTNVPPRGRRYLQGGLVVAGSVVVVTVPLLLARGRQPGSTTILVQDVGQHLALLLVVVTLTTTVGYLVRVVRDRRRTSRGQAPRPR